MELKTKSDFAFSIATRLFSSYPANSPAVQGEIARLVENHTLSDLKTIFLHAVRNSK